MPGPALPRLFAGLLAALALAMPALAEVPSPVRRAELSARLYQAGVEASDPILILAAARLRKGLNPQPSPRAAEGGEAAADTPLDWGAMLDTAEALAAGDEALLGVIGDVRDAGLKGVATGPVYNIGALGPGKTDAYPAETFRGGEYAEVYVEAKSATDMNLRVFDGQGRLVCSDTDSSHIAYCGWTPAADGAFVMKVENKGATPATYALMTN